MSNRLTFSLASLFLIFAFGLVFVATPVLAHNAESGETYGTDPDLHKGTTVDGDGHVHPTVVEIKPDTGTTPTANTNRAAYRVLITFSHGVDQFAGTAANVQWQALGASSTTFAAVTSVAAVQVNGSPEPTGTKYVATLDFSGASGVSSLKVRVPERVAQRNDTENAGSLSDDIWNLASTDRTITTLPKKAGTHTLEVKGEANDATVNRLDDYIVTFTFTKVDATGTDPVPTGNAAFSVEDGIQFIGANGAIVPLAQVDYDTPVVGTNAGTDDNMYTMTVRLSGRASLTVKVNPSYADITSGKKGEIELPIVPTPTISDAPPKVSALTADPGTKANTIRLSITFERGNKINDNGTPGDKSDDIVTDTPSAPFRLADAMLGDYIEIEDRMERPITPALDGAGIAGDNTYLALLTYSELYDLPITITAKEGKFDGTTAPKATIAGANEDPMFSASTATRSIAEDAAVGTNVGTPITATDADDDTLTYTLSGTDEASFAIDSATAQLSTAVALDYETTTSYSVTVTASDGKGGTDATIAVTINVTDVADTVVPPTVDISLVSHDEAMMTFQVRFAFAEATVDASVGTAGPVPTTFMAAHISVTKAGATAGSMVNAAIPDPTVIKLRGAGQWVATVDYSLDPNLPLYVGLADPSTVSMINGMAADGTPTPTLRVPADDGTTPPPANAPAKPDAPTAMINATNNLIIDVSWTAPADGGSAITGYVVKKYEGTTLVKTFPGATEPAITATMLAVGPVPEADRGKSFTFTVTAMNANGSGPESDMSAAVMIPAAPVVVDNEPPTVEITVLSVDANGKHTLPANGMVEFDLLFSEPLNKDPESISRLEVRDFFIADHRNVEITEGVTLSDPVTTTMMATTGPGYKERYTLTVPAGTDPQEVRIALLGDLVPGGQVADLKGLQLVRPAVSKFDTIPPDVRISVVGAKSVSGAAHTFSGEPRTKLTYLFVFTEPLDPTFNTTDIHRSVGGDNFTLGADSDPRQVAVNSYTVIVTVKDVNLETTVLIKRLEVSDAAKNQLQQDRWATYAPTTQAPVASIGSSPPFKCGADGNPITVTITDNESIKAGESIAMNEISVSAGWKIATGSFRATTARAGTKSVTANFRVVRNDVENANDRSWLGIQEVAVSVAAGAVKDNTEQTNAAVSKPHTAGPVITIPAGQYVVVVRESAWRTSHLNNVRTLFLGDYNVRTDNIQVQPWDCMPDLGLIFDVTVDASPGIGGGGLMVLQSRDHTGTAIAKGTVGISEIMWSEDRGIPFGNISNLQHAREQWVELHNTNNFPVKVTLFDLIRDEAYRTKDAGRAGLVDVMSNYDIGGRWDVQAKNDDGTPKYGTDGNSELGHDFISMQRRTPASDKNYAHGERQGRAAGHWSASPYVYLTRSARLASSGQVPAADLLYNFQGSPGRSNTFSAPGPITRTNLPKNLIFNEVSNRRDQTLEWIELKNTSDAEINLRKYQISYVTAKGTDTLLYNFPDDDNIKLAAGEILLLLDTDPRDNDAHPIAVAFNRDGGNDQALGIGANAIKYKVANFAEGGLPDDGKFVLLLRNRNDRLKSHEGVLDAIGYDDDSLKDDAIFTNLWPLKYFNGSLDARNMIAVETVHRRQHKIDPDKNTHGDDKDEHQALRDVGYTGIGYKRHAQNTAAHGGTPGHEDTRKNLVADVTAAAGVLTISEIMYDQGDGDYPQWVEIYNSSDTPVNLHSEAGWRLVIENFDDDVIPVASLSGTLNFKNSEVQTILPKQTVMVASTRARNSGSAFFDTRVIFPDTRVFSVWADQRDELGMKRSTAPILSEQGFYIELIDGKGNFSDGVGNLVKSPNRRVAATIEWPLTDVSGAMEDDAGRSSILRRYREYSNGRLVGAYSAAEIEDMGVTADGWIAAHKTAFRDVRQTWYGHRDDIGSPGITGGRVLPVSLSKFRPERLESGAIVIRWITESETNNAGFNILRSETKDGEFKQINTKLIAGQGTTSERTTYTHTDTSAKPNVVYYYQIQDVSLDGKVQTLRMSRLKGHISAAGKATTTWGELKALRK